MFRTIGIGFEARLAPEKEEDIAAPRDFDFGVDIRLIDFGQRLFKSGDCRYFGDGTAGRGGRRW